MSQENIDLASVGISIFAFFSSIGAYIFSRHYTDKQFSIQNYPAIYLKLHFTTGRNTDLPDTTYTKLKLTAYNTHSQVTAQDVEIAASVSEIIGFRRDETILVDNNNYSVSVLGPGAYLHGIEGMYLFQNSNHTLSFELAQEAPHLIRRTQREGVTYFVIEKEFSLKLEICCSYRPALHDVTKTITKTLIYILKPKSKINDENEREFTGWKREQIQGWRKRVR